MGNWLYANGPRSSQDANNDEWGYDEDLYDVAHSDMATFVVRSYSFLINFCRLPLFLFTKRVSFHQDKSLTIITLSIFHICDTKVYQSIFGYESYDINIVSQKLFSNRVIVGQRLVLTKQNKPYNFKLREYIFYGLSSLRQQISVINKIPKTKLLQLQLFCIAL